jgi:uncharacterized membrane protein YkvA (DUF1232 family)
MAWWEILIIAVLATLAVMIITAMIVWRMASRRTKQLASRINGLPWRAKLQLAGRLAGDERIPVLARIIPPLLVLYLALPLDIVPDFIPVIGQLDDVLVLAVGIALLVKFTPLRVLDEHLTELERQALDAEAIDAERMERQRRPTLPPGS